MRNVVMILAAVILLAAGAAPQGQGKEGIPEGWKVRYDQAGAEHGPGGPVKFWTMPPGWHVTTGPACILYNPATTAKGNYRIESESFLFDPGQRREAYGIFFGGKNLEAESLSYSYFLIRRDGRFLVKQREGGQTREIVPWTEHPAIVKHEGGEKTAKNVLAVEIGAAAVDFFVNGQKVSSLPRAQLSTEGVVGLRINHSLNVHVTSLNVQPR
jgi:hypothetical protein